MGTVVGSWRLNTIILLFILLTSVYIVNGFFYGIQTDEAGYVIDNDYDLNENVTSVGKNEGNDFITLMFSIGDYLTFGNIQNSVARLSINMFVSICWITIGYIIYTFIKEWVPLT